MRIALFADSHLSERAPECLVNWRAAAAAARRWGADLGIHLGDITLDGENHREELVHAASLLAQWPGRLRCVAGNHDMGTGSGESPLDPARLAACEARFGDGRWSLQLGHWQLIGLNAQLLGSATMQEEAQWRWLDREAAAGGDRPAALFLHRPVLRPEHDHGRPTGRYVADAARERLLEGPLRGRLRAVFSGHTHQFLDRIVAGVRHVWVPSTAFVIPDALQPRVGEKVVGLGLLELDGPVLRFSLLCPEGMTRHDAGCLGFWSAPH